MKLEIFVDKGRVGQADAVLRAPGNDTVFSLRLDEAGTIEIQSVLTTEEGLDFLKMAAELLEGRRGTFDKLIEQVRRTTNNGRP